MTAPAQYRLKGTYAAWFAAIGAISEFGRFETVISTLRDRAGEDYSKESSPGEFIVSMSAEAVEAAALLGISEVGQ